MEQLIEFAINHWELVLAFIAIAAFLLYDLTTVDKGSLEPLDAVKIINHQDALVIDVRPAMDFMRGHIIHAMNFPLNSLQKQLSALEKHKERPIIMNCDSGARSAQACNQLRQHGFTQVYNLRGGILAWENANLPITRKVR
jgi:rhodanese-related sulfurtransferase